MTGVKTCIFPLQILVYHVAFSRQVDQTPGICEPILEIVVQMALNFSDIYHVTYSKSLMRDFEGLLVVRL